MIKKMVLSKYTEKQIFLEISVHKCLTLFIKA